MDYRKLGMEAVSTFVVILVACTSSDTLATGLAVALMMYLGYHISGTHLNPAVSFAVFMRGRLPKAELVPYIIAQMVGGLAAALISFMITHDEPVIEVAANAGSLARQWGYIHGAITGEFMGAFLIAFTYLVFTTTKRHAGKAYFGALVGLAYLVADSTFSRYSGGAYNPAAGLGRSIVGLFEKPAAFQWFWVYLIFPILGGWVAAIAFRFLMPDEIEASDRPAAPPPPPVPPQAAQQQPNVTVAQQ